MICVTLYKSRHYFYWISNYQSNKLWKLATKKKKKKGKTRKEKEKYIYIYDIYIYTYIYFL